MDPKYVEPAPIIDPAAATSVKWAGAAIFLLMVVLIAFVAGVLAALLAVGVGFGVMMFCVGMEAELSE